MANEIIDMKETVEKHTDVYAFGVTMWEVFQTPYHIPYHEWNADEVYNNVVEGTYRLSPQENMPPELGGLMKECLGEGTYLVISFENA
ncbi:hypothetical protein COOONC_15836 [Cooperia oncophora]